MKDTMLQQNMKGRILRLLLSVCVFVLVAASTFLIYEVGFAADDDETEYLIEDIQLVNRDDPNISYGFASSYTDKATTINITDRGGHVDLLCVIWWDYGSPTTDSVPGLTITSSDYNIVAVDGMTITGLHDGDATLTVTVSEHTKTGEPIILEVPVHVAGQDKPWVDNIVLYCDSIYYDQTTYDMNGYMTIEVDDGLAGLYLDFYAIVTVYNPVEDQYIDYNTGEGLLSTLTGGDLGDLSWKMQDTTLAEVSDYGQVHPTKYGDNGIWVTSSAGLDGKTVSSNEINYKIPDPDQPNGVDGWGAQDSITFNIWYENDNVILPNGNFSMPTDENLVKTLVYDQNDLEHVRTFWETYTLVSGSNLAAVTARGYGVDLEDLLVEVCGLDPSQGTGAIQTLRFYDAGGDYKQVSASWLFQTRYYYPNIDIGSKAAAVEVRPMLAFESWWQRGNIINWDAVPSDSTRYRLIFGSNSLMETVTSFSWKWVNRIDVILEESEQVETGGSGTGDEGGNEPAPNVPGTGEPETNEPEANEPETNEPETNEPNTTGAIGGSGSDSGGGTGSGTGTGAGSGTGTGTGIGSGLGSGTGTGAGSGSGFGIGSGSNMFNADDDAGSGLGLLGSGDNDLGGDVNSFNANYGSVDAEGEGSGEGANAGFGSGEAAETGSGSGSYNLYQVMNPFSSDIGIEHEDNPLTPFLAPIACATVAVGVFQGLLWFLRQRRRTLLPLSNPGALAGA